MNAPQLGSPSLSSAEQAMAQPITSPETSLEIGSVKLERMLSEAVDRFKTVSAVLKF